MRDGWEYKKLGEVCSIERGGSPRPISDYITESANGINWIKIGDAVEGSKYILSTKEKIKPEGIKKSRFVHEGDFILSNSMSFGKPYILGINGCIHDGWLVLHDNNNTFSKDYLYYVLSNPTMYSKFAQLAVGGVVNNLNSKLVREVVIPIPPLSTQLSIVSELDKINELIRLKKEQLSDYDKLAQSLFYEMFGDPVENEKRWEVKKLCEVSIYPNKRIALSDITSYEYVGVETLVKNKGGVLFSKELPNAENAIEFIENDILIGNIRPYLKKIWKSDRHGGASGDVVVIRISDSMKEYLNPVYLFKLLSTDEFFEYDNANTHGAKMPRGDRKAIGEFTIQIPSKHIQKTFAQRIELIEQQKAEIQSTIADLETLLASRMQYWFD